MIPEFDVAIVGGAFSGAATGLLLKRRLPEARILIIEKATEFDRKVGESTTEVSSCFLTRILGLTNYLGHEQLVPEEIGSALLRPNVVGHEEAGAEGT